MKTKVCRKCEGEKPISEFAKNRYYLLHGLRDGKSIYCKACHVADMKRRRAEQRERKEPRRKPMVKAPRPTIAERVRTAVAEGHHTREAIGRATRLHEDTVCDTLAQLAFDDAVIRIVRIDDVRREFHIAA